MDNFRDYSSYAVLVIELKDNEAQAQVLSAALEVVLNFFLVIYFL